jgi:hypothetical protein
MPPPRRGARSNRRSGAARCWRRCKLLLSDRTLTMTKSEGIGRTLKFDAIEDFGPSYCSRCFRTREHSLEYSLCAIEAATKYCLTPVSSVWLKPQLSLPIASSIGLSNRPNNLASRSFVLVLSPSGRYSYSYSMRHVGSSSRSTSTAALSTSTNKSKH